MEHAREEVGLNLRKRAIAMLALALGGSAFAFTKGDERTKGARLEFSSNGKIRAPRYWNAKR